MLGVDRKTWITAALGAAHRLISVVLSVSSCQSTLYRLRNGVLFDVSRGMFQAISPLTPAEALADLEFPLHTAFLGFVSMHLTCMLQRKTARDGLD